MKSLKNDNKTKMYLAIAIIMIIIIVAWILNLKNSFNSNPPAGGQSKNINSNFPNLSEEWDKMTADLGKILGNIKQLQQSLGQSPTSTSDSLQPAAQISPEELDQVIEKLKTETEPINTSDWLTYRNEEYGFEFMYPLEIKIVEQNKLIHLEKDDKVVSILRSTYSGISTKLSNPECYQEFDQINLNNIKWSINAFLCGIGDKSDNYYSTTHNNTAYEISISKYNYSKYQQLLNNILSTFKFLD